MKYPPIKGGAWPEGLSTVLGWINTIWGAGAERDWQYQIAYWLNEIADYCVDLLYKVEVNYGILHHAEYGNENLAQRIATVEGKIDTLLARPAGTSGSPVSIGTTGAGNVADAVWDYEMTGWTPAREFVESAGLLGHFMHYKSVPIDGCPGFSVTRTGTWPGGFQGLFDFPAPDWADIRAADTPLTWLQRTEPIFTWVQYAFLRGPTGTLAAYPDLRVSFIMTVLEWAALKAARVPTLPSIPPYPGAAYVTLGTPVPFDDSAKVDAATYGVDGRMDGVFILADVVPADQGLRHVQDVYNYYRLGWLVFEDEEANCDRVQALGPDRSVFTPCQFRSPVAVTVSCRAGVSGTITPWIATP